MQMFGLVSLLIAVAAGVWLMVSSLGPATSSPADEPNGTPTDSTYEQALESARSVVESVKENNSGPEVTIYDGIKVGQKTQILDLSNRGLSGSLKAEVGQLVALKEMNLSNNNFTGLPAEVGRLAQLEVLNLSDNPFTGLPYELANLHNLQVLDLRGTNYSVQDLAVIKAGLPATTKILTD